jgi:hypothetical protein
MREDLFDFLLLNFDFTYAISFPNPLLPHIS